MSLRFDPQTMLQIFNERRKAEQDKAYAPLESANNLAQTAQGIGTDAVSRRRQEMLDSYLKQKNDRETQDYNRQDTPMSTLMGQPNPNPFINPGNASSPSFASLGQAPQGNASESMFRSPQPTAGGIIDKFHQWSGIPDPRNQGYKPTPVQQQVPDYTPRQLGYQKQVNDQNFETVERPLKLKGLQAEIGLKESQAKKAEADANRPIPKYVIPQYDASGAVIGYSEVPQGAKPFGGGKPPMGKGKLSTPDAQAAFNLYETARDGLLSGLEGSTTGPIMGRFPAMTKNQQIAEGGVAAMAPVLKQLFRTAGEGTFSDRDQALLLQMVPTRQTDPAAIPAIVNNIDNIVKAKLGVTNRQNEESGADPLGIR